MTYIMEEADRIGKSKGVLDLPFEVVVYRSGGRGHHKNDVRIWQGQSMVDAIVYYDLAVCIIKMFISNKWAMVVLRGNGKWYNRATFKDGKVKEETS